MEKEKHLGSETKRRAVPAIVALLIVALLLGLVAITVVGGVAFGAIVGERLQAESMSESSGSISLQSDPDGSGPAGRNLRWASGAGVSARAQHPPIDVGTTVNQIQLFTRQASANTAVFAIYVDGTAAANRVGIFRPPAGSTWRTVTVNLTTAIGPGRHTLYIGPNATFSNNAFVDWFELHNTGSTPPPGGDTTPPETSITSADLGTTNDNTPTFTFTGTDQAGVTGFECRVYSSGSPAPAFSSCASPYTTATPLSEGNYVFEVSAKDAAGNVDATPASDSFTFSGDAPSAAKPNFVFILTDDMRYDDLAYMTKTKAELGKQGMTFTSAFVPTALCCPSRATIMRGQYTHNTGVWFNANGPSGGWEGYKSRGHEEDNVATRLDAAGYRTGYFGKYLNEYDGTAVPPHWDDWFAMPGQGEYFNYDVNDNGTMRHFGTAEGAYSTDVLSAQTQEFIGASVGAGEPFFAYVAPKAPHADHVAAPRHEQAYDGVQAPRPPTSPAFNEEDVSDKPSWIRSLPRLTTTQIANIDNMHEGRVKTLQAVDDLVGAVVTKLDSVGALGNTYIVFTSDNGFQLGEHRTQHKSWPYEESIHVPLLVRGPDVRADSTTDKLVLSTDFLPTFTDLAGTTTPPYVDGRSLRPVLTESATSWRTAILLENRNKRIYSGVRESATTTSKYLEYEGGFRELYTLSTDPHEMSSTPTSSSAPSLQTRLQALKSCAADSCRAAENGP